MEHAADIGEIFRCSLARWTGMWGDPIVPGTIAMLAYGIAGVLLWRAGRAGRGEAQLWRIGAIFFFFQVFNVHLDLHAWPTAFGHCLAKAQGWYEDRGPLKLAAALLIGTGAATVLIAGLVLYRRSIRANALLSLGLAIAGGITLLRGIGWNAVEEVYNNRLGSIRWAELIELAGIAISVAAALLRLAHARSERRRAGPERATPLPR